jgi:hypothetical protein
MTRYKTMVALALLIGMFLLANVSHAQGWGLLGIEYGTGRRMNSGSRGSSSAGSNANSRQMFNAAAADQAARVGFVITGTSGRTSNGFVEWISYRPARLTGSYARQNTRHLKELQLGRGTGWVRVDQQKIVQIYNAAVARANSLRQQIEHSGRVLNNLAGRYRSTNHPGWKRAYAQQFQQEKGRFLALAQARQAEFNFMRSIRR